MSGRVDPEKVLQFSEPTEGFLCSPNSNTYGIEFLSFLIRDYDTKRLFFEVSKESTEAAMRAENIQLSDLSPDSYRKIRYNFPVDVLRTPTISTTLTFCVGPKEVDDFRMIERHYFRDQLVKSYDFTFGFCIPNSTNTWEAVYAVPLLDEALVEQMCANPHETRSDSFYFVNDKLIMHNKAEYSYTASPAEAKTADAPAGGAKAKKAKMKYAAKMGGGGGGGGSSAPPAEGKAGH